MFRVRNTTPNIASLLSRNSARISANRDKDRPIAILSHDSSIMFLLQILLTETDRSRWKVYLQKSISQHHSSHVCTVGDRHTSKQYISRIRSLLSFFLRLDITSDQRPVLCVKTLDPVIYHHLLGSSDLITHSSIDSYSLCDYIVLSPCSEVSV